MSRSLRLVLLVTCQFSLVIVGIVSRPASASPSLLGRSATSGLAAAHPLSGEYAPSQIASAYNYSPLYARGITGKGQTVALIETDAFRPADLQSFDSTYGLPATSVKEYYVGGKKFKLEQNEETMLDVEWLHALAPGAKIQIYYLQNKQSARAGWKAMATALTTATKNGARIVSISLGGCSADVGTATAASAFASVAAKGVSVFVASGDTGDRPGPVRECGNQIGVGYPASDPSVVAVGGTSLQLDDTTGTIQDEVAWRLSGGGLAVEFSRPAWQVGANLPRDNHRWAPDVSFVADPSTGVSVTFKQKWHQVGGTSLGAPAWAAAWALVRQNAAGAGVAMSAAPSILYKVGNSQSSTQAFHDVVAGSNGRYAAGPGWDSVTGWGTPDVNGLATVLQTAQFAR